MDLTEYPPEYHAALRLLIPLWRGLSTEYKQKYARNIWEQFESNIRAAAYTSKMSKFYSQLCSRFEITLAANDLPDVLSGIAIDDERRLLRQLRDEAPTLTLMVRLENEKRKEEWKQRQTAKIEQETEELWS